MTTLKGIKVEVSNYVPKQVVDELAQTIYDYSKKCSKKELRFNERDVVMMLRPYTEPGSEIFKELFAIFAVSCFENLLCGLVFKSVRPQFRKEAISEGRATIYNAAMHYDWHNSYRREYELTVEPFTVELQPKASKFITYCTCCITTALISHNANMRAISVPFHERKTMAVIEEYYRTVEAHQIRRNHAEDLAEILKILSEKNVNSSKETVNHLMWANKALHGIEDTPIEEVELSYDEEYDSYDDLSESLNDIIARVYDDKTAYISHLKHEMGLSTYEMVDPFIRYGIVSRCIEEISRVNSKIGNMQYALQRQLRLGGEERLYDYLSNVDRNAINSIKSLSHRYEVAINSGECSTKDFFGFSVNAAGLNYQYKKAWPNSIPNGKDLTKHIEFREELAKYGYDSILANIEKKLGRI
jgi:hypothetical protein